MGKDRKPFDEERFRVFEAAFGEFKMEGKVTSVFCDECKELIEIKELGPEEYEMNCPCGRYKDVSKGL